MSLRERWRKRGRERGGREKRKDRDDRWVGGEEKGRNEGVLFWYIHKHIIYKMTGPIDDSWFKLFSTNSSAWAKCYNLTIVQWNGKFIFLCTLTNTPSSNWKSDKNVWLKVTTSTVINQTFIISSTVYPQAIDCLSSHVCHAEPEGVNGSITSWDIDWTFRDVAKRVWIVRLHIIAINLKFQLVGIICSTFHHCCVTTCYILRCMDADTDCKGHIHTCIQEGQIWSQSVML